MPDMVAPIAPNTFQGRPSVQPLMPFPFPNCYHWIETETTVRVKVHPEKYDHTRAVCLNTHEHIKLLSSFTDDYARIGKHKRRKLEEAAAASGTTLIPGSDDSQLESEPVSGPELESSTSNEKDSSISSDTTALASLLSEDIFGWDPDPNVGLIPLVDLWFELDEQLTPDTIPDPMGLYAEEKAIKSCALLPSCLFPIHIANAMPS